MSQVAEILLKRPYGVISTTVTPSKRSQESQARDFKASAMPYRGSRVSVRFMVNAEMCLSERMYKKKVRMVQSQLRACEAIYI